MRICSTVCTDFHFASCLVPLSLSCIIAFAVALATVQFSFLSFLAISFGDQAESQWRVEKKTYSSLQKAVGTLCRRWSCLADAASEPPERVLERFVAMARGVCLCGGAASGKSAAGPQRLSVWQARQLEA